jgi:FlaA1/EpsC-like NDP-sugar epimerase
MAINGEVLRKRLFNIWEFWFLPIEKAAQLVIKAGGMGEGGEVFSLDRGARLSMRTIAKDLC